MAYINVDIDLGEFEDQDILQEVEERGLSLAATIDDLPSWLQDQIREYLAIKIIGPMEMKKYLEWAKQ